MKDAALQNVCLGALVTEAVVAKVDVPEAAVAAEGARQGLRSRTPHKERAGRESSGVHARHLALQGRHAHAEGRRLHVAL